MSELPRRGPRRWREQRWLVDVALRTDGLEWDQPRIGYTLRPAGVDAGPDFRWVAQRVRLFADLTPMFEAAGRRRERLAREAEDRGHIVAAREHYFIASLMYLSALWSIFEHNPTLEHLSEKANECYAGWIRHAPHRVERVELPFGDGILPGYFHLPPGWRGEPVPAVVACGGMDAPKELVVSQYGDKLLERGFAVLAIDGPGQGEAPIRRAFTAERAWVEAGKLMVDWLAARPEVDPERLVASGVSFGSFWMTEVAATQPRLKGCAVGLVCHEPGGFTIFEEASPTFKARYMWMANIEDEAEFDRFARTLDLMPLMAEMRVPWLSVAGEEDELSPIRYTYELAAACGAPSPLLVYQSERHAFSGAPSTVLGPNWYTAMCDWLLDRVNGKPADDAFDYVTNEGRVERLPHPRRWGEAEWRSIGRRPVGGGPP